MVKVKTTKNRDEYDLGCKYGKALLRYLNGKLFRERPAYANGILDELWWRLDQDQKKKERRASKSAWYRALIRPYRNKARGRATE